jgi:hypothetical protein
MNMAADVKHKPNREFSVLFLQSRLEIPHGGLEVFNLLVGGA